jgi:hypothetical protein
MTAVSNETRPKTDPVHLEGWPAGLPEPRIDFSIDDEGGITTVVTVEGRGTMRVWTDNESSGRCDYDTYADEWSGTDAATIEEVFEWAAPKHRALAAGVLAEMRAAADRARGRLLKEVTGLACAADDVPEAESRS